MNKEYVSGTYIKKDTKETVLFECLVNPSLSDKQHIVNQTINSIVDGDFYHMFLKDIILDLYIVSNLTNIDLSQISDADYSTDSIEDFFNNSNIVESIVNLVGSDVVKEIKDAVNYGIEYRTGIHDNDISRRFSSLINTFNDLFLSIDPTEVSNFIKKINSLDGEITVDKILESYANSNEIKQMYIEADRRRSEQNDKIANILEDINKEGK